MPANMACVYIDEAPKLVHIVMQVFPDRLKPLIAGTLCAVSMPKMLILAGLTAIFATLSFATQTTMRDQELTDKTDDALPTGFLLGFLSLYVGTIMLIASEQNVTKVFPAVQRVPTDRRAVYIDSGCTKSVFCNDSKLINVRVPDRKFRIVGVGGQLPVTKIGDFPLALRNSDGSTHTAVIEGCLVAPDSITNLLAATDVSKAGLEFNVPAGGQSALLRYKHDKGIVDFPLQYENGLYQLPYYRDVMTHFAGVCSHQLRALTEYELWHRRLGHASSHKIAKLSHHCKGMKAMAEHDLQCHQCQEGKATRQPYPDASTN
jgi:hypothetical protein